MEDSPVARACEVLADVANEARISYIKLRLVQESMHDDDEEQGIQSPWAEEAPFEADHGGGYAN